MYAVRPLMPQIIRWCSIMMPQLQRRAVLGGAIAGAALLQRSAFAQSAPNPKIIPWSDQPRRCRHHWRMWSRAHALGEAGFLDHAERQVLQHRALRPAR